MNQKAIDWINENLGVSPLKEEKIQSLWSGYGELNRVHLSNGTTLIHKAIHFPKIQSHPRGWNSSFSDQRKRKSYEVEMNWYQGVASRLEEQTKIPQCIGCIQYTDSKSLFLEDLDQLGYKQRFDRLDLDWAKRVVRWLARFHATYLNVQPTELWKIGTYWHLDTRPDEFHRMEDSWLKENAHRIDEVLNNCRFKTIVHGDAKVANFCFSKDNLAAVDFQYVGGGCGMKDVVYFISSCLSSQEAMEYESILLDVYFEELATHVPSTQFNALEEEWRKMYPIAWADFLRFLLGWAPEHYKINTYSLTQIGKTKDLLKNAF